MEDSLVSASVMVTPSKTVGVAVTVTVLWTTVLWVPTTSSKVRWEARSTLDDSKMTVQLPVDIAAIGM